MDDFEDDNRKLRLMMTLIAQGYEVEAQDDRYVIVENPDSTPDNGIDPYLIWDCEGDRVKSLYVQK